MITPAQQNTIYGYTVVLGAALNTEKVDFAKWDSGGGSLRSCMYSTNHICRMKKIPPKDWRYSLQSRLGAAGDIVDVMVTFGWELRRRS